MRLLGLLTLMMTSCIVHPGDTYRILGLFPYNAVSHFVMFERLMKGLAERGHQVDVVGPFPLTKPFSNYNDIVDLSSVSSNSVLKNNLRYEDLEPFFHAKSFAKGVSTRAGNSLCEHMGNPQLRQLITNPPEDPPYDLVITEVFGAHCYMALGPHLGVPVVGVVTSAMWPWANNMVANPEESAYVPHVFSNHDGTMNFWQRLVNTVELWIENWKFNYYSLSQNDIIFKAIGPHAPSIRDAERNVSLILVNSHFSLNGARPFTTAVVEVGGLHIPEKVEPLSNDLQQWLDDSKNGFVYISFGAMTKLESFPHYILYGLYASLTKLVPTRVLMKIANATELPPGLPDNVLTSPWVPQSAVLKHKHIRVFVTHGGLMGTQEAVYYGVPMIGVPLFADQGQNIQIYVRKHVAVSLRHEDLTEKNLDAAFTAILGDSTYREAAKKLSAEFRDRPMPPLETAIFWIEHVIRHGGRNLRSPAMDLTWWQIALLDVYGAIFLAVVISIYLSKVVIKKLIMAVLNSQNRYKLKFNKRE